ncbi:MAG: enoyl-CoA hydratase/isomerase family protein [Hyphomicrobiaceae bacterium]
MTSIVVESRGRVTRILLDRPDRRNAMDHRMVRALVDAIAGAEADRDCGCLVIAGKSETFCSGRDLGDAREGAPLEEILAYDEDWTDVFHLLTGLSKPSLAVVRGHAVAGGFTLAMGCDFVIAEAGARFGALEMRGGFPAAVNTAVLSRLVGPRQALEYLLSADTYPAEHLRAAGLVNRVATDASELSRIEQEWSERLAALDPTAVKLTKEAHRTIASMPISEALVVGRNLNALMMSTGRISEAARRLKAAKAAGRG